MKRKPKQREEKKKLNIKKRWDYLSSVNAKHWTSLLQNMLHFMAKKTGRFLHMKEMSLLSITIFFRSLVIRNSQSISTCFIERYYQSLLKRRAVINPLNKTSRNGLYLPVRSGILISCLENCFEQAVKWELMEKNPCTHATVPKHNHKKKRHLDSRYINVCAQCL